MCVVVVRVRVFVRVQRAAEAVHRNVIGGVRAEDAAAASGRLVAGSQLSCRPARSAVGSFRAMDRPSPAACHTRVTARLCSAHAAFNSCRASNPFSPHFHRDRRPLVLSTNRFHQIGSVRHKPVSRCDELYVLSSPLPMAHSRYASSTRCCWRSESALPLAFVPACLRLFSQCIPSLHDSPPLRCLLADCRGRGTTQPCCERWPSCCLCPTTTLSSRRSIPLATTPPSSAWRARVLLRTSC